jgi:hypothetical protein
VKLGSDWHKNMRIRLLAAILFPLIASAQLTVTVSPVRVTAQKAVVPLALKNGLSEKIESARAVVFLFDEQGKMIGQGTKWVVGGPGDKAGLEPGATNSFNFVVAANKPITKNPTAKISFNRVVLEGGKLADVNKAVQIQSTSK